MEIRSLVNIDFDTLYHGFESAFADYAIRFEKDEVRSMLKRRGYNPRLSFAAFEGGEIVAFILNGTGIYGGVASAYDTGTGTVKEYRGRGLAAGIFTHSIPFLKEAGIRQYVLEVLQDNSPAVALYRRMGFRATRSLDCFRGAIGQIDTRGGNAACTVAEIGAGDISGARRYCDFAPSWQNSSDSIARAQSDMVCLGAFAGDAMVGYCAIDPHTGDVAQIAVERSHRRRGIASRLLSEALARMKTDAVKILNVDAAAADMHAFLASRDIPPASRQYEMIRPLD